jgi:hypothetical protein
VQATAAGTLLTSLHIMMLVMALLCARAIVCTHAPCAKSHTCAASTQPAACQHGGCVGTQATSPTNQSPLRSTGHCRTARGCLVRKRMQRTCSYLPTLSHLEGASPVPAEQVLPYQHQAVDAMLVTVSSGCVENGLQNTTNKHNTAPGWLHPLPAIRSRCSKLSPC